jgi:hypothetical protein
MVSLELIVYLDTKSSRKREREVSLEPATTPKSTTVSMTPWYQLLVFAILSVHGSHRTPILSYASTRRLGHLQRKTGYIWTLLQRRKMAL